MERKNKELKDRHEKASKGKRRSSYSIDPPTTVIDVDQLFRLLRVQLVAIGEDNKNLKKGALVDVVQLSLKSFERKKMTSYIGGPPTTGIDLLWHFSRSRLQLVVIH